MAERMRAGHISPLSVALIFLLTLFLAAVDGFRRLGRNDVTADECQYRCSLQTIVFSHTLCSLRCSRMEVDSSSVLRSSSSSKSALLPGVNIASDRLRRRSGRSRRQAGATKGDDPSSPAAAAAAGGQPMLRVAADVRQTRRSNLDAVVTWSWSPVPPSSPGRPYDGFVLHWARDTCNLDHRYPYCDDPDIYLSKTFRSQSNYTIGNLTYNSKYWVEVEYDNVIWPRVTFTTPGCIKPSDTFRRCLATSVVTTTAAAGPGDDHALRVSVTCYHLDIQTQVVRVVIRWNLPPETGNQTWWESTVLVQHVDSDGVHMEVQKTRLDAMTVTLTPDKLYEITVKASIRSKDVVYRSLHLNTSRDRGNKHEMARDDADCLTASIDPPDYFENRLKSPTIEASLNPLILAMTILAVVVMTTAALLCVNRCRGFQSKLLKKKTLLSKSNSYKTTPETPRMPKEEQLQMILKTDDWELDARDVTLGAELGQGAFGLVMTGYYQNAQVAIKVLKGDVLPSYREELLREIALMKRIGKHPNIVSLIGACTLRDPIALIMEYMPFGNLQAFLQNCRLEGGLRRKDTGAEVEYSPLDELSGTKEVWTLSSTDMLSFARQVAVAMEFLTDRKYVHRDLAARNVLVGQNKVVKLCDFGLARLVYNGDQYYKMSNGRLPLKWMALESIRDRVFTAQTDVWSYGVLLWEIATLGCSPYPNIALVDLYRLLTEGYRMDRPKNCSPELYNIMVQCWQESAFDRPTFAEVRVQLDSMLTQRRNYLDLDCLDPFCAAASATAAAYTAFPPSTVDLLAATEEKSTRMTTTTAAAAATAAVWGDLASGCDHQQQHQQLWNSEEDSGYLRSSEIATSVAQQQQQRQEEAENWRQEQQRVERNDFFVNLL